MLANRRAPMDIATPMKRTPTLTIATGGDAGPAEPQPNGNVSNDAKLKLWLGLTPNIDLTQISAMGLIVSALDKKGLSVSFQPGWVHVVRWTDDLTAPVKPVAKGKVTDGQLVPALLAAAVLAMERENQ